MLYELKPEKRCFKLESEIIFWNFFVSPQNDAFSTHCDNNRSHEREREQKLREKNKRLSGEKGEKRGRKEFF